MSDNRLRPAFKTEDGLPKCIDLLHSCLDEKDWNLACLGNFSWIVPKTKCVYMRTTVQN